MSTISSAFTEEDDEEEDQFEVEMKYVPPEVQEEPPGKKLRPSAVVKREVDDEEDVDDEFIRMYLGDGGDDEEEEELERVLKKEEATEEKRVTMATKRRKASLVGRRQRAKVAARQRRQAMEELGIPKETSGRKKKTPEEIEAARERNRERNRERYREKERQKRAAMTPEQRKKLSQKAIKYRQRKLEGMTEQEKAEDKQRRYFQYQAKLAMMTPEEREAYRQRCHNYYLRKMEKLKSDPEKMAALRKQWGERKRQKRELGLPTRETPRIYVIPRKTEGEETGQEKERRWHLQRVRDKKAKLKRKLLKFQEMLKQGKMSTEGEEGSKDQAKRERRCVMQRIVQAKNRLLKELKEEGVVDQAEIDKRLSELDYTYTPQKIFRAYRPRLDKRKEISEKTLKELQKEIDKLEEIQEKLVKGEETETLPMRKKPEVRTDLNVVEGLIQVCKVEKPKTKKDYVDPVLRETQRLKKMLAKTSKKLETGQQKSVKVTMQVSTPTPAISYPNQQYHHLPPAPTQPPPPFPYPPQNSYTAYHPNLLPPQFPPPPPQTPANTLQNILDNLNYNQNQTYHPNYQQSTTSSQEEEYAPSTYFEDDDNGDVDQGPPSPPEEDYEDTSHSEESSSYQGTVVQPKTELEPGTYHHHQLFSHSVVNLSCPTVPRKKPVYLGRKPVNRPKKDPNIIRDVVCDTCGVAYNRFTLKAHQNQMHNPNYDSLQRKCKLCGESYSSGQKWYSHYLQVHEKQDKPKDKDFFCEECGKVLSNKANYEKHQYYMHGDGLKPENYIKCPLCPEERRFKEKMGYYNHLRKQHPDYQRPGHDCFRCSESFPNDKVLGEHVRDKHSESYFPCQFCKICKFSRLGLNFHYLRCKNCSKEDYKRLEGGWEGEVFTVERWQLKCEFCEEEVVSNHLQRHYKKMHNVIEEEFGCNKCGKTFRARPHWINHLEEKHRMGLEELRGIVGRFMGNSTEGLSVKRLGRKVKYVKGGRGGRRMKNVDEETQEETVKVTKKRRRRNLEDKKEPVQVNRNYKTRRKRNVVVICEEDELELKQEGDTGFANVTENATFFDLV